MLNLSHSDKHIATVLSLYIVDLYVCVHTHTPSENKYTHEKKDREREREREKERKKERAYIVYTYDRKGNTMYIYPTPSSYDVNITCIRA